MKKESILYMVAGLLLIFLVFLLMRPEAEVVQDQVMAPDITNRAGTAPLDEEAVSAAQEEADVLETPAENVMSEPQSGAVDVKVGALMNNTWLWQKTQMNDGAVIVPKQPNAFTLTFGSDGRVSGTTDCNGFGGSYEEADGVLSMGQFMMTMMYCEGSQEMEFQSMLSNPVTFMFTDAGELVLMLPYDSGSVIFTPVL